VTLTDRAEGLDIYLEIVPSQDVPWSEYYLALGSVGLATMVVTWLNVGPFAFLSDIAAGMFLGVTLFISAVANYYTQYESRLGDPEKPPELRGEH
jgi:hypothetical protein